VSASDRGGRICLPPKQSGAVFHEEELPEYLDSDSELHLARELPCEALDLPAALLVRSLGYVGDSYDDWELETLE